ncbi:MAG TPA: UDP-N-acetylglucosamine 1-carboxyvinyltransferase, partial [Thermoleptolyngbya sp. M55_K2018_002]|nr:UDP-N-acetylglucosamine 1-carboxyvinyltransferase [Thermoleptolyngbya sp. M55_K2018_002]
RGTTIIQGLHHLDRGYDDLEGKLKLLGGQIRRVKGDAGAESVSSLPVMPRS